MSANDAVASLLALMRRLRDRESGCPWDREQTFATIAPHTIEEAYEVADAIARDDSDRLRDELGDLLFQVVFHARMAEERGWFDFEDVASGITAKLTRRHPHVFGDASVKDASSQTQAWENIKAEERSAAGAEGVLADVPIALPALTRAAKLGKRAGRVGFDWPDAAGARRKVDEELAELDAAIDGGEASARRSDELGDLLFAIVNWARHLGLDAEGSLRGAARKFEDRFALMEAAARERGLVLEHLDAEAWDRLWNEAKARHTGRS